MGECVYFKEEEASELVVVKNEYKVDGEEYSVVSKFDDDEDSRWTKTVNYIIKRLRDGKLFWGSYEEGLTEINDGESYWHGKEGDRVRFDECREVEKVIKVYECV